MSPGNNVHKGSETEIKSLMERLELNKSHSDLVGLANHVNCNFQEIGKTYKIVSL